jgi:hypothetical protein
LDSRNIGSEKPGLRHQGGGVLVRREDILRPSAGPGKKALAVIGGLHGGKKPENLLEGGKRGDQFSLFQFEIFDFHCPILS